MCRRSRDRRQHVGESAIVVADEATAASSLAVDDELRRMKRDVDDMGDY